MIPPPQPSVPTTFGAHLTLSVSPQGNPRVRIAYGTQIFQTLLTKECSFNQNWNPHRPIRLKELSLIEEWWKIWKCTCASNLWVLNIYSPYQGPLLWPLIWKPSIPTACPCQARAHTSNPHPNKDEAGTKIRGRYFQAMNIKFLQPLANREWDLVFAS